MVFSLLPRADMFPRVYAPASEANNLDYGSISPLHWSDDELALLWVAYDILGWLTFLLQHVLNLLDSSKKESRTWAFFSSSSLPFCIKLPIIGPSWRIGASRLTLSRTRAAHPVHRLLWRPTWVNMTCMKAYGDGKRDRSIFISVRLQVGQCVSLFDKESSRL